MDDWEYMSNGISPDQMYGKLLAAVKRISQKKSYGAIGFHPWVNGEDEDRLRVINEFMATLQDMSGIKIVTFRQAHQLYRSWMDNY